MYILGRFYGHGGPSYPDVDGARVVAQLALNPCAPGLVACWRDARHVDSELDAGRPWLSLARIVSPDEGSAAGIVEHDV
jgi:hypothetical protein